MQWKFVFLSPLFWEKGRSATNFRFLRCILSYLQIVFSPTFKLVSLTILHWKLFCFTFFLDEGEEVDLGTTKSPQKSI